MSKSKPIEWRQIPSYPDYEVSEFGEVRRLTRAKTRRSGHILKGCKCSQIGAFGDSYMRYKLSKNGVKKTVKSHRLVAEAFHGPAPSSKHQALHKDGSRSNNHHSNLYWGTMEENMADTAKHGIRKGSKNGNAILTEAQVKEIRANYKPAYGARRKIAEEHGISLSGLDEVLSGNRWRHVR